MDIIYSLTMKYIINYENKV